MRFFFPYEFQVPVITVSSKNCVQVPCEWWFRTGLIYIHHDVKLINECKNFNIIRTLTSMFACPESLHIYIQNCFIVKMFGAGNFSCAFDDGSISSVITLCILYTQPLLSRRKQGVISPKPSKESYHGFRRQRE